MFEITDTHCHIDNEQFSTDRERILTHCRELGVNRIIVPAVCKSGWGELLAICNTNKGLYPALGLHPLFIDNHSHSDIDDLETYLSKNKVIAIGEIGLDYYIKNTDKESQIFYFEHQLSIADKLQLPVILHVRKSHDAVIQILRKFNIPGGIIHAFSGSKEQAYQYIKLGFKLGFGGVLTYIAATKIRKLAKELPLDSIVLETDAPDMTVFKYKGERNSPEYILESLEALATIRQQSIDEIASITTNNAKHVFGQLEQVI